MNLILIMIKLKGSLAIKIKDFETTLLVATFPISQMQKSGQFLIYNIQDFVCIQYITHKRMLSVKKNSPEKYSSKREK